jgi:DNA-binding NarL/FixJ family response regulator
MRIRVVHADDSYLAREAVSRVLELTPSIELVATCADRGSLLSAIESQQPAVVLAETRMPPSGEAEGIRIAQELRRTAPDVGVVVLSQYAEPRYVIDLLEGGSAGRAYLLKERVKDRDQLVAAIETVARGGSVIDPELMDGLLQARAGTEETRLSRLTPRELEILGEIADGRSNAAIAGALTKRAVEKHVHAILFKLDLPKGGDVSRRVMATLIYLSEDNRAVR